jgi:hypothetical protein
MKTNLVGAVLVTVILSACRAAGEDSTQRALVQLAMNRQHWFAAAIHDYSFDYDLTAMIFSPPLHIVVKGDTVNLVADRNTGAVYGNGGMPTVDSLFARIAGLISSQHSDLSIEYNLAIGYPTRIEVDSNIPDAGSVAAITNFQRAP